jgi:RNA polymerase sigma-70 factor, ECF subfamily
MPSALALLVNDCMSSPAAPFSSDEGALVARARAGDLDAFEVLYKQTSPRIYSLCVRMTGDVERAKELLQDVYVRVWERLATFRGESAFSSWLHRLAVNAVLTGLRSDRRRRGRVTLGDDLTNVAWEDTASESPTDAGTKIDLERALERLPPTARQVFVLHDIEGYKHEEIAERMGTAAATVRVHLCKARKRLTELLRR